MRVYTEVLTFDGGGNKQLAAVATRVRAYRMYVEPDAANTHVAYVGDPTFVKATSTVAGVIKQLAKPTAADAVLDHYDVWGEGVQDGLELSEFNFDGTSGEKVRVTLLEK